MHRTVHFQVCSPHHRLSRCLEAAEWDSRKDARELLRLRPVDRTCCEKLVSLCACIERPCSKQWWPLLRLRCRFATIPRRMGTCRVRRRLEKGCDNASGRRQIRSAIFWAADATSSPNEPMGTANQHHMAGKKSTSPSRKHLSESPACSSDGDEPARYLLHPHRLTKRAASDRSFSNTLSSTWSERYSTLFQDHTIGGDRVKRLNARPGPMRLAEQCPLH